MTILKILLLIGSIILCYQDLTERKITTYYGILYIIMTTIVYRLNPVICTLSVFYYLILVGKDKPVDNAFLIIAACVVAISNHVVDVGLILTLYAIIFMNEKKIPFICVCSSIIGYLTLVRI